LEKQLYLWRGKFLPLFFLSMKFLFTVLFVITCFIRVEGQNAFQGPYYVKAHAYIGGPSLAKTLFKFSGSLKEKITYENTPLFGGNVEAYVFNWLTVGAEFTYRHSDISYEITDSTLFQEFDEKLGLDLTDLTGINPLGKYTLDLQRLRILAKATAHVIPNAERSDLFVCLGLGYNGLNYKLTKDDQVIDFTEKIPKLSLPVAFRLSLGYSYYFIPNLGITGEIGVGGPLLTIGLSGRF